MAYLYADVIRSMMAFDNLSAEGKADFCRNFGIDLTFSQACNVYAEPEDAETVRIYEHITYSDECRRLGAVLVDAFMEYMREVTDSREAEQ